MALLLFAIAFLFLIAAGCGKKKTPLEPDSFFGSDEEYEVYRTLLADTNHYGAGTIVLVDSTQAWDFSDTETPWDGRMPELSDETLQDFLSVNRTRVSLKRIEFPGKTCVLISSEQMTAWKRTSPDAEGTVTVSRVGFNRSSTQALVYWSVFRAPDSAQGSVALLEKENGRWMVRQNLMIWIVKDG